MTRIREATAHDWPAIWPIVEAVVRAGETFTYPTGAAEEQLRAMWMLEPPGRTVVAVDATGR